MLKINSEIRKYYWQDFSVQRMIAMPAVLLAIFYLTVSFESKYETTAGIFHTIFLSLAFLWGGYKAAASVIEEVKENTWDNQRLSCALPLNLSLGKLFGSTLYSWYGAAIALVIFAICSVQDKPVILVSFEITLLLLNAIFCQSFALLASIESLQKQNRSTKLSINACLILGIIVASFFYNFGTAASSNFVLNQSFAQIKWFNTEFNEGIFIITSLVIFLIWSLFGTYRLMRAELKFKNIAWVWGLFVIFIIIYLAGFVDKSADPDTQNLNKFYTVNIAPIKLTAAFVIAALCTYLALFNDAINITRYRALIHQWQNKNFKKVAELTPKWMISFVIVLITALLGICFTESGAKFYAFLSFISAILLMIRDAAILHYFKFSPNNNKAFLATFFYLVVLYCLLPLLLASINLRYLALSFFPIGIKDTDFASLMPTIIQLFIVYYLLKKRYKKMNINN